jgi:hypothetical protein
MCVKNASRQARLRAKFTEMSADSIRYPENSTPLHCKTNGQHINQRFLRGQFKKKP